MKTKSFIISMVFLVCCLETYCQEKTHSLVINISVAKEVSPSFKQNGRLFIYMSKHNNSSRWKNPESDTVFEYTPNCGPCEKYSHRRVLEQITEKLEEKNEKYTNGNIL